MSTAHRALDSPRRVASQASHKISSMLPSMGDAPARHSDERLPRDHHEGSSPRDHHPHSPRTGRSGGGGDSARSTAASTAPASQTLPAGWKGMASLAKGVKAFGSNKWGAAAAGATMGAGAAPSTDIYTSLDGTDEPTRRGASGSRGCCKEARELLTWLEREVRRARDGPNGWPDSARTDLGALDEEVLALLSLTQPLDGGGGVDMGSLPGGGPGVHSLRCLLRHAQRCLRVMERRRAALNPAVVLEELAVVRRVCEKLALLTPLVRDEMDSLLCGGAGAGGSHGSGGNLPALDRGGGDGLPRPKSRNDIVAGGGDAAAGGGAAPVRSGREAAASTAAGRMLAGRGRTETATDSSNRSGHLGLGGVSGRLDLSRLSAAVSSAAPKVMAGGRSSAATSVPHGAGVAEDSGPLAEGTWGREGTEGFGGGLGGGGCGGVGGGVGRRSERDLMLLELLSHQSARRFWTAATLRAATHGGGGGGGGASGLGGLGGGGGVPHLLPWWAFRDEFAAEYNTAALPPLRRALALLRRQLCDDDADDAVVALAELGLWSDELGLLGAALRALRMGEEDVFSSPGSRDEVLDRTMVIRRVASSSSTAAGGNGSGSGSAQGAKLSVSDLGGHTSVRMVLAMCGTLVKMRQDDAMIVLEFAESDLLRAYHKLQADVDFATETGGRLDSRHIAVGHVSVRRLSVELRTSDRAAQAAMRPLGAAGGGGGGGGVGGVAGLSPEQAQRGYVVDDLVAAERAKAAEALATEASPALRVCRELGREFEALQIKRRRVQEDRWQLRAAQSRQMDLQLRREALGAEFGKLAHAKQQSQEGPARHRYASVTIEGDDYEVDALLLRLEAVRGEREHNGAQLWRLEAAMALLEGRVQAGASELRVMTSQHEQGLRGAARDLGASEQQLLHDAATCEAQLTALHEGSRAQLEAAVAARAPGLAPRRQIVSEAAEWRAQAVDELQQMRTALERDLGPPPKAPPAAV